MEALLPSRERDHDEADQEDQAGDDLGEVAPGGAAEADPVSFAVGDHDPHRSLAYRGLGFGALLVGEVHPLAEQHEQAAGVADPGENHRRDDQDQGVDHPCREPAPEACVRDRCGVGSTTGCRDAAGGAELGGVRMLGPTISTVHVLAPRLDGLRHAINRPGLSAGSAQPRIIAG